MAKETTEKKLYDLLVTRDYENFQALDSRTGKVPANPQTGAQDVSMADMFAFDSSIQSDSSSFSSPELVISMISIDFRCESFNELDPCELEYESFDFLSDLDSLFVA